MVPVPYLSAPRVPVGMPRPTENLPSTNRDIQAGPSDAHEYPTKLSAKSNSSPTQLPPHTLSEFREREGRDTRKRKLQDLWQTLPRSRYPWPNYPTDSKYGSLDTLTLERAESLKARYDEELVGRCGGHPSESRSIGWRAFKDYAEAKESGMDVIFLGDHLC